MRPVLVLALFISATLFLSSAQMPMPTTHLDGDHGWAGPHPSQLVSYSVKVPFKINGSGWGPAKIVVPSIPGNGLVITGVRQDKRLLLSGRFEFRILQNTTEEVVSWQAWSHKEEFGNGLPLKKGVPLSIQAFYTGSPNTQYYATIDVIGYIW